MADKEWNEFYMVNDGGFTFYIDMVDGTYVKNSLTPENEKYPIGDLSIDEMFQKIRNN